MAMLFRAMRRADDGRPRVGRSARELGVRPVADIAISEGGLVEPGEGMSVVQESPEFLDAHRRPTAYGGTSRDPLWQIDEDELGAALEFRPDEPPPNHGLIEPAWTMTFEDYELALAETRDLWAERA